MSIDSQFGGIFIHLPTNGFGAKHHAKYRSAQ
jgi:hypothetical protein